MAQSLFYFRRLRHLAVTIKYRLTANDYLRGLIWYQWKRMALIFPVVLFLMLLFGLAVLRPSSTDPYKRAPLYFAVVITPIFLVGFAYVGLRRQAAKMEAISEESELTASDSEMRVVTSSTDARMKWDRLKKVVEINKYFVFFPQDNVYFVVPKQRFVEANSIDEFRSLLKSGLDNRARLKN